MLKRTRGPTDTLAVCVATVVGGCVGMTVVKEKWGMAGHITVGGGGWVGGGGGRAGLVLPTTPSTTPGPRQFVKAKTGCTSGATHVGGDHRNPVDWYGPDRGFALFAIHRTVKLGQWPGDRTRTTGGGQAGVCAQTETRDRMMCKFAAVKPPGAGR